MTALDAGIRRVAYRREEAAVALGVSPDHFDEHIRPELRAVRLGRVTLYPHVELERFLERTATRVLGEAT